MSNNKDTSFIEYNVAQPTQDFVTNFDTIGGTTDVVLVTVDGVLTDTPESSYTVQQINHNTWRVTPEVQTGSVVRLYRVTDLDQMMHVFTAGAKFIARNVDSNFKQIRHSQQEVQDSFTKLSEDTNVRLDGFYADVQAVQDEFVVVTATANNARDTADTAISRATLALDTASAIDGKASTALSNATEALSVANAIDGKATDALANSVDANLAATEALDTANAIDGKATTALSNSSTALTTANTALSTANGIDAKATQAQQDASTALSTVTTQKGFANGIAPLDANVKIDPIYIESMDVLPYLPLAYPKSTPPVGYLALMGQTISQATYPILYSLYGATLPDLRGQFLRGLDYGRGIDTDRVVLSEQGDAIRNITGGFASDTTADGIAATTDGAFQVSGATGRREGAQASGMNRTAVSFDASLVVPTAEENRVKNIAFLYIVKAG